MGRSIRAMRGHRRLIAMLSDLVEGSGSETRTPATSTLALAGSLGLGIGTRQSADAHEEDVVAMLQSYRRMNAEMEVLLAQASQAAALLGVPESALEAMPRNSDSPAPALQVADPDVPRNASTVPSLSYARASARSMMPREDDALPLRSPRRRASQEDTNSTDARTREGSTSHDARSGRSLSDARLSDRVTRPREDAVLVLPIASLGSAASPAGPLHSPMRGAAQGDTTNADGRTRRAVQQSRTADADFGPPVRSSFLRSVTNPSRLGATTSEQQTLSGRRSRSRVATTLPRSGTSTLRRLSSRFEL